MFTKKLKVDFHTNTTIPPIWDFRFRAQGLRFRIFGFGYIEVI